MNNHLSVHPSRENPGTIKVEVSDEAPETLTFEYRDSDLWNGVEVTVFTGRLSAGALQDAASAFARVSDQLFNLSRERMGLTVYMGWDVHPSHHFAPVYGDDNVECTQCAVRPYNDDAKLPCPEAV